MKRRLTGSDPELLDKLGVRAGMRVAFFEFADPGFAGRLAERGATLLDAPARDLDIALLAVEEPAALRRLADIRPLIRPNGAIWVLRTKGLARRVSDVDVIEAARHHALVDNKIASFSDSLAAMRLVIPLALRPR